MFTRTDPRARCARTKAVFTLFGFCAYPDATVCLRLGPTLFRGWLVLLVLGVPPLVGCSWGGSGARDAESERGARDDEALAQQGRAVFAEPGADARAPRADDAWVIVLATLPEGADSLAGSMLERVRTRDGIRGARLATRSGRTMIVAGAYDGPGDGRAVRDLERYHAIEVDGRRPYARAFIAPPPPEALAGSDPAHDLRTVKARFGDLADYTLQIGVYGRIENTPVSAEERRVFREAAEAAVRELRAQGERAFYYHAPNLSMVTVGVFGSSDFDPSTMPPMESERLKALRAKYPHNLLNGKGIRQTETTDTGQRVTRLQPSVLVGIPDPE